MNNYPLKFEEWSSKGVSDCDLSEDLRFLETIRRGPNGDNAWRTELADRFYKELDFGTGGLRGVIGLGTNRMNRYIVRKVTRALASFLLSAYGNEAVSCGVVIAYDSRIHSALFAKEAALTLAFAGIPAKLFSSPAPTPMLSFAVRNLGCIAGIVITASHNPKEYNGYKIYDQNGCQLTPHLADQVSARLKQPGGFFDIPVAEEDAALSKGLLTYLGDAVLEAFTNAVLLQAHPMPAASKASLGIVYSPLHGTGGTAMCSALSRLGYRVDMVPEQSEPDGNFPTVCFPNPEDPAGLSLGIRLARRRNADLVIATDPDCDRVGVAVLHQGEYLLLTGNQVGALLVNYLLLRRSVQPGAAIVKTIVTNDLGAEIGKRHGLHVAETLTGFKYIGEQIGHWQQEHSYEFLFGYEESFGYLVGTHARDKDAVVAGMLICEMTAYYMKQDKTLITVLEDIYNEYGFYLDAMDSFSFSGMEGEALMSDTMSRLRELGTHLMPDITEMADYLRGVDNLPLADVLKYKFEDGSWLAVRPSGTEPKMKVYYSIRQGGNNKKQAQGQLEHLRRRVKLSISN